MEERARKTERAEALLKNLSVYVSSISFWVIAFCWNYLFQGLELVPRLGLGAALSWVVFLHVEAMGMIIMSMMREKWQSEAREARAREALALAREALAQAETREAQAREAQAGAREALAQTREEQAEAREAQAQEVIRDLRRQLREARGEGANGVEDA